jgi:Transposase/Transposase IS116/IS110/IS902 family
LFAYHQFVDVRVEQIVQPGGPGSFLEGHRQSSAQACKELKNCCRFGLDDRLLKDENQSDRIDARKLTELLRGNQLKPVYHGETGVRMLRELSRSYLAIVKDLSRVMNRVKAVDRSWAIPRAGRDVYYRRHRDEWLGKIKEADVRRRAERLYQQLDMLRYLRHQARRELLAESRTHAITAKLRQIPYLGPIRSALAVALMQTPHRFRTKRQLWAYSGLALETRISAEYRMVCSKVRPLWRVCVPGSPRESRLRLLFSQVVFCFSIRFY